MKYVSSNDEDKNYMSDLKNELENVEEIIQKPVGEF